MQRILSGMRKAISNFNMIEDGDKIAVCLSGGKDSITLLKALKAYQRFSPQKYDLIAISINPGFDFFDENLIKKICEDVDVSLFIENSHAKEIVFDIRQEKNPCSLCANIRRGAINSIAIKVGCNKIALGHNKDDVIETLLLNLLYTGNMSSFAPVAYMDRTKITVIRPLICLEEKEIKAYMKRAGLTPMAKCCPMDGYSKREDMKKLISSFKENDIPQIKENLFGAIQRSNINGWKVIK